MEVGASPCGEQIETWLNLRTDTSDLSTRVNLPVLRLRAIETRHGSTQETPDQVAPDAVIGSIRGCHTRRSRFTDLPQPALELARRRRASPERDSWRKPAQSRCRRLRFKLRHLDGIISLRLRVSAARFVNVADQHTSVQCCELNACSVCTIPR
jgi:hypothetical protein